MRHVLLHTTDTNARFHARVRMVEWMIVLSMVLLCFDMYLVVRTLGVR